MRRATTTLVLLTGLFVATPAEAQISAKIVMVGFPGEGVERAVYRGGAYAPIAIELTTDQEDPIEITLHVEQLDRDGDVVYTPKTVTVSPSKSGRVPLHWLYFVPNPDIGGASRGLSIQLLDRNGESVQVEYDGSMVRRIELKELPEPLDTDLARQHFLVLSVTDGASTAGKIREMSDYANVDQSEYTRPLRVAHISSARVPDHWHGLEMVDAIVWDVTGPVEMTSSQQQAIIHWVEHGGQLVLAAGSNAAALADSELGAILPVKNFTGVSQETTLPELRRWRLDPGTDGLQPYDQRLAVARCELRDGAEALVASDGDTRVFLAKQRVDNGTVTFLAVNLQDLLSIDGNYRNFFQSLLNLRKLGVDQSDDDESVYWNQYGMGPVPLFERMHEPINFQTATTVYMLLAIAFVIVYGLLATWGSWLFLRSRNILNHSWTAFGLVAIGASVVSAVGAQSIRGVGQQLHQITIVDTEAGTSSVRAHAYFGLKTSTYVEDLDALLPDQGPEPDGTRVTQHYLRPLSPKISTIQESHRFADTKRYAARPSRALLEDVPIRATLKQLEGYWTGTMMGQINGRIVMRKESNRWVISEGSEIINNLGHDLHDCILIEAELDPDYGTTRNLSMYVHELGDIKAGQTRDLDSRLYIMTGGQFDFPQFREQHSLQRFHTGLVSAFSGSLGRLGGRFSDNLAANIENSQKAILLLTTFSEYEADPEAARALRNLRLLQTNGRWLDLSAAIDRRHFLFVGFTEDPGPVQLFTRRGERPFAPISPRMSQTVYRVLIPVERL